MKLGLGITLNRGAFVGGGLDPDAKAFITASGATDKANINDFVKGMKDLGLWTQMVCLPMRSSQNAGTGTTVYSLGGLGTYNGTLVNGPTWGSTGITFNHNSNHVMTTAFTFGTIAGTTSCAMVVDPTGGANGVFFGSSTTPRFASFYASGTDYSTYTQLSSFYSATVTNPFAGTFHFAHSVAKDKNYRAGRVNGGTIASNTTTDTSVVTLYNQTVNVMAANNTGTTGPLSGTMAFIMFSKNADFTEYQSVRTLLKDTLCNDLSLS